MGRATSLDPKPNSKAKQYQEQIWALIELVVIVITYEQRWRTIYLFIRRAQKTDKNGRSTQTEIFFCTFYWTFVADNASFKRHTFYLINMKINELKFSVLIKNWCQSYYYNDNILTIFFQWETLEQIATSRGRSILLDTRSTERKSYMSIWLVFFNFILVLSHIITSFIIIVVYM